MSIRTSLLPNEVEKVIAQHQLPDELYDPEINKLDCFEQCRYNPSFIQYEVSYFKGEELYCKVETLYSKDSRTGYLTPKCSQTFFPEGHIIIAAHDRDLNNDCDFGFRIRTLFIKNGERDEYHRHFDIMEDIQPIFSMEQVHYIEKNHTFPSHTKAFIKKKTTSAIK